MSVHRIKDLDHEALAYVLTYNAPLQLRAFFESARAALCGLERYRVIVVNQSDRDETTDAYQQICDDFLAAHVRTQNAGASGGWPRLASSPTGVAKPQEAWVGRMPDGKASSRYATPVAIGMATGATRGIVSLFRSLRRNSAPTIL